jgi:hypothetical protein
LILGEFKNNIEIIDSNTMSQLTNFKLSKLVEQIFEIKKTKNINEYGVCTSDGLYFIEISKVDNKFYVVEN